MCGPSRNRKQEAAVAEQNRLLEEQRQQAAAQLAEQQRVEAQRKSQISANSSSIDSAFAQFDDSYFNKAADNVRNYYTPQINKQFDDAQRDVALYLADKGLSDSSVAARKAGELKDLFESNLQNIESKAQETANSTRSDVAQRKSNLKGMAEAGNSLDNFQSVITPQIQSVNLPTTFSDLGQVFSTLTNNINTLQKSGMVPTYQRKDDIGVTTPTNSSRIVK